VRADPRLLRQVEQADGVLHGQRVGRREQHVHRVVEQRVEVDPRHDGRRLEVVLEDDGEVELATPDPVEGGDPVHEVVDQPDPGRIAVEDGADLRGQVHQGGQEGPEAHRSPARPAEFAHLLLGPVELTEGDLGMGEQHPSGLGGHHPAPGAQHQHGIELAFEQADLPRDRRLGQVQGVRGGREGAVLHDRTERQELRDIEHAENFEPSRHIVMSGHGSGRAPSRAWTTCSAHGRAPGSPSA
jgi:hypothetical protein